MTQKTGPGDGCGAQKVPRNVPSLCWALLLSSRGVLVPSIFLEEEEDRHGFFQVPFVYTSIKESDLKIIPAK